MNADEIKEEILHQRDLQKEYRKRIRVLEKQAAKFGDAYVPPHIQVEIDELTEKIQACEQTVKNNKSTIIQQKRWDMRRLLSLQESIAQIRTFLHKQGHEIGQMLDDIILIGSTINTISVIDPTSASYFDSLFQDIEKEYKGSKSVLSQGVAYILAKAPELKKDISRLDQEISEIENL
jgi:hypothetical protein